jgi:hypothetical protein
MPPLKYAEKGNKMATCRDCLHDEACRSLLTAMGYTVDGDGNEADKRCDTFKTKTKYAEVVRCKDCKHFTTGMAVGMCKRNPEKPTIPIPYNHFCSFGERKDNGQGKE